MRETGGGRSPGEYGAEGGRRGERKGWLGRAGSGNSKKAVIIFSESTCLLEFT